MSLPYYVLQLGGTNPMWQLVGINGPDFAGHFFTGLSEPPPHRCVFSVDSFQQVYHS